MISTTHSLLAFALLSKTKNSKTAQTPHNWAIFIGSFLPDLVIYIWAPYQIFVKKIDGKTLWNDLYFAQPMQDLIAYFNSIPIYVVLALIAYCARQKLWGQWLLCFALAALIHMATDLPVHNHDAYRHFWPISDWRFISPFSYYEAAHHGAWVSFFESLIALASIVILWKRFPLLWSRILFALLAFFYISMQFQSLLS